MTRKIKYISILIVAAALYSTFIFSFFRNHECSLCSDCAMCKFVDEFSSADNAALPQPLDPFFASIYSLAETLLCILGISAVVLSTRAPPLSVRFRQSNQA